MYKDNVTGKNISYEQWDEVITKFPVLNDKMVVDLINGMEVAKDHIRYRETRQTLFNRISDSITGKGAVRQQLLDQNIVEGIEGMIGWLNHLQFQKLQTDRAVTIVATKLSETRECVAHLVNNHVILREKVQDLTSKIDEAFAQVDERLQSINETVQKLGQKISAMAAIENAFCKWQAGYYERFSPLAQLILVLEELYWGPFGFYDRQNPELREIVKNKCIVEIKRICGYDPLVLVPTEEWMRLTIDKDNLQNLTLYYLLSNDNNALLFPLLPLTNAILQKIIPTNTEKTLENCYIPYILHSKRLCERLVNETLIRLSGGRSDAA